MLFFVLSSLLGLFDCKFVRPREPNWWRMKSENHWVRSRHLLWNAVLVRKQHLFNKLDEPRTPLSKFERPRFEHHLDCRILLPTIKMRPMIPCANLIVDTTISTSNVQPRLLPVASPLRANAPTKAVNGCPNLCGTCSGAWLCRNGWTHSASGLESVRAQSAFFAILSCVSSACSTLSRTSARSVIAKITRWTAALIASTLSTASKCRLCSIVQCPERFRPTQVS